MFKILTRSVFISLIAVGLFLVFRTVFHTDTMLVDVGGLGVFASFFGVLYGLLTAFVVFEVWGQYNKTVMLIEKEAMSLEKLYRVSTYFRDAKFLKQIMQKITEYITVVSKEEFVFLGEGKRLKKTGDIFRSISQLIANVQFNDDHDQLVFDHVLEQYNQLTEIRSERNVQCLARLPGLLRMFLYTASMLTTLVLVVLPFSTPLFGILCVSGFVFILSLILQLVEDLDNPFSGYWNISPEPFERALKHIQEDY